MVVRFVGVRPTRPQTNLPREKRRQIVLFKKNTHFVGLYNFTPKRRGMRKDPGEDGYIVVKVDKAQLSVSLLHQRALNSITSLA